MIVSWNTTNQCNMNEQRLASLVSRRRKVVIPTGESTSLLHVLHTYFNKLLVKAGATKLQNPATSLITCRIMFHFVKLMTVKLKIIF